MSNNYPFGMAMPNRKYQASGSGYRYGFNGKEKLDEIYGGENAYDYGERIYDPRLGRLLSIDPLIDKYPELSSYQYANNSPIANIDLLGQQDYYYMLEFDSKTGLSQLTFSEKRDVGLWGMGNIFPSDAILEYPATINGKSYMAEYYLAKGSAEPSQGTLDVYNGKSRDEIATMMAGTPTKWGMAAEGNKKIAEDLGNDVANGFILGTAIQKNTIAKQQTSANNKVSTEGKKESTNNSGTQNAGGKNNTTNPQKAGAVTGTPTAGANAKPVIENKQQLEPPKKGARKKTNTDANIQYEQILKEKQKRIEKKPSIKNPNDEWEGAKKRPKDFSIQGTEKSRQNQNAQNKRIKKG